MFNREYPCPVFFLEVAKGWRNVGGLLNCGRSTPLFFSLVPFVVAFFSLVPFIAWIYSPGIPGT